MSTLRFRCTSALATLEIAEQPKPSTLVLGLELALSDSVLTPQGEDLGRLNWSMRLDRLEAGNDGLKSAHSVGTLVYVDSDPAVWFVKVSVGGAKFDCLMAALQIGRMPQEIYVVVTGLPRNVVATPIWDVQKVREVPVAEVTITFPVGIERNEVPRADGTDSLPLTKVNLSIVQLQIAREFAETRKVLLLGVVILGILAFGALWHLISRY